nr:CPCC family cysteine-rich protein [Kosakonia radicincitans]
MRGERIIDGNQLIAQCAYCGSKTITEPGNYEICPVCKWEDDPAQSSDRSFAGGANTLSLAQAQRLFSLRSPRVVTQSSNKQ